MLEVSIAFGLMTLIRYWIPSCLRYDKPTSFKVVSGIFWVLISSLVWPLLLFSFFNGNFGRIIDEKMSV